MVAGANIAGPAWDLSSEYPDADSVEVQADLARLDELTAAIEGHNKTLLEFLPSAETAETAEAIERDCTAVGVAQQIYLLSSEARRLIGDLGNYANCRVSVDSTDEAALRLQGMLQGRRIRFGDALSPLDQFLDRIGDAVVEAYLEDETAASSRFQVLHRRKRRHELLSLEEERLVGALAEDGIHAWGRLYSQLSGTLRCQVTMAGERRQMGIAAASGLMLSDDDSVRESAWRGINAAWESQEETCAAALNAIAGWRLEVCRRRSTRKPVHFLDAPVHTNRIERATLDALMSVARESVPIAQRVARAQARAYRKERIGPWDGRAPAPSIEDGPAPGIPYDEAIAQIRDSYGSVRPEMGDFVAMMAKQRWIEGTVSDHKRPGAYCTRFMKSKTPRVYSTYTGGMSDVITLAHELGHAFHGWTMRDLPDAQQTYGMALAETASTFGETVVRDALLGAATDDATRFQILWEECSALPGFVLNISTRFEFERSFYQAREERPQRPDEIKLMMSAAWKSWFGDCLSEPDPMFWAWKLHFYISGLSFYNFPYLFGYLFSLGVYAQRERLGADFYDWYLALLRDTGAMTAEELAQKHLGVDLTRPEFWRASIQSMRAKVEQFEALAAQLF